jgi:hypothetical protein
MTPLPFLPTPQGFPPAEAGLPPPEHDGFGGLNPAERATRAEILHRAYSIWESKGRPEGSAVADWLAAETEIRNE